MLGGTLFLAQTVGTKAQAAKSVRHIGSLSLGCRPNPAYLQQMWGPTRELGWIEGQNLIVDRRYAGGNAELASAHRGGTRPPQCGTHRDKRHGCDPRCQERHDTYSYRDVFRWRSSAQRPRCESWQARRQYYRLFDSCPELDAKRLTLLRELLPTAQRVAVLVNPANSYSKITREELERVCRSFRMQPIFVNAAETNELENAVAEAARRHAEALIVTAENVFWSNRVLLMRTALEHRLPTIVGDREILEAGGLLSLAHDAAEQYRALAYFVDRILRVRNRPTFPFNSRANCCCR